MSGVARVIKGVHLRIWGFPKIGVTIFGCPYKKDYSILGSILGFLYFGKLPFGDV